MSAFCVVNQLKMFCRFLAFLNPFTFIELSNTIKRRSDLFRHFVGFGHLFVRRGCV